MAADIHGSAEPAFDMVVAIDFGTSSSGYAYAFDGEPDTIHLNPLWQATKFKTTKTPTCVLMNNKQKCIAFGYNAYEKYAEMTSPKDDDDDSSDEDAEDVFANSTFSSIIQHKVHLFKSFKMELHSEETWDHNIDLTSEDGYKMPALVIFTEALRYLKEHVFQEIEKQRPRYIEGAIMKWVITVPAIWSEGSKKFMRIAATKAGLVRRNHRKLEIALEPEAASYYCRKVPITMLNKTQKTNILHLPTGSKYMVVDCGGGTVDITLHVILEDGSIAELYKANGGPWGSTFIDNSFVKLLEEIFDVPSGATGVQGSFIHYFKSRNPAEWLELCLGFENKKCGMSPVASADEKLKFEMPLGARLVREVYNYSNRERKLSEFVKSSSWKDQVIYKKGKMIFKEEVIHDRLLKPTIDAIVYHLQSILTKPRRALLGLTHLFMVGGFSQSLFLQEAMKNHFGDRFVLCYPNDAEVAVLKGAVMFGFNPKLITRRIARRTLGIQTSHVFIDGKHDLNKRYTVRGVYYCQDILRRLVTKNQEIKAGVSEEVSLSPETVCQKAILLHIYSVDREDVMYVTEKDVKTIGKLIISLPDNHYGPETDVIVKVEFGFTEMKITARNSMAILNQPKELTIDFSEHQI